MTLTAGALTLGAVSQNSIAITSAVATGGTGPYTYQWYRSTTTGFSPGAGNILTGKTALALVDTTVVPNTAYFYKLVATDTGNGDATVTSSQQAATTPNVSLNPNAFSQSPLVGVCDLPFNTNTMQVMIDFTQATALYPGQPVKMVTSSAGAAPRVVGCSADSDEVLGYINFNGKDQSFTAGKMATISLDGNVIYLYSTTAISAGQQCQSDIVNNGVAAATGSSGAKYVGWAVDATTAGGQLFRMKVKTPSYTVF